MSVVDVQMRFTLPMKLKKRKNWYVASCPVLDVVTQGETKAKAKSNLKEALVLFFETCIEQGTLDTVLKNCGFKMAKQVSPPQSVVKKEEYISIPIDLLVSSSAHRECHA